MSNFVAMGGYAAFVWPAFGISVAVLIGLAAVSLRFLAAKQAELAALESRAGSRGAP